MTSNSHAILEFRDADQYRQPVPGEGHEILKPKPRRPETLSTPGARSLKPARNESVNNKSQEKPPVPVKSHCQTPRNPIVVKVEMHPEPDTPEKLRPSDRSNHKSSLPIDWGSLSKSSSDGDGGVSRCKHPANRKSRRRNIINLPHHHLSMDQLHVTPIRQEMYAGSSSDENRSSGHASMSDSHTSSSPLTEAMTHRMRSDIDHGHAIVVHHEPHWSCQSSLKSVPEDDRIVVNPMPLPPKQSHRRLQLHRSRNRREEIGFQEASGLAEIREAMEAMTMRSCSGSESESGVRRLMRHSSLETVNTNVTSADEFVWIDSHSRLVEVQHLPWSNHDILRVLQTGRLVDAVERISMDVIPRLSYLLQRALVRIAIEIQRFSRQLGLTSKQEVNSAFKVILAPALAHSCIQACIRAAAMLGGEVQFRLCKSSRAGLHFSIGRFHRWMCDVRLGKFIHEYAAIYLTAGLENLLEEIMIQCMPSNGTTMTAVGLEHSIANNGELWGLLQPYSHLNTGRTASGELAMPRWPSSLSESDVIYFSYGNDKAAEQSILTTCVGSISELKNLLNNITPPQRPRTKQIISWSTCALETLFYFMRCSQLEHAQQCTRPIQELVYERPYAVLPPLIEWVRIATAHCEHCYRSVIDKDDVMQAARLLLPGVDCPVRHECYGELFPIKTSTETDSCNRWKTSLAFRMIASGRTDLVATAIQLLPSTKLNTLDDNGLTPLMVACLKSDENLIKTLLKAGADVNIETPSNCTSYQIINPQYQKWTALTYATLQGSINIVKLLLESGANVEGGVRLNEEKMTVTPLQLAAATGNLDLINVLLLNGAQPFLTTVIRDSMSFGKDLQQGCYSPFSVAAAHGQRMVLHKLLSNPYNNASKDILSLEEILAEANNTISEKRKTYCQVMPLTFDETKTLEKNPVLKLTKKQMKTLQEAMYHSAESSHLEITLDLCNIGVPWTLHCWMHALATATELRMETVIDQILQDFHMIWSEDSATQFVEECLPLLFDTFRQVKNEGTSLLLAEIFSNCFGKESIKFEQDINCHRGVRIDPKYVNNPELSDVQFRVEGRIFYAHKIILVNCSPCFKTMLSNRQCDGDPPIVQINEIRYDIFQTVMEFLYKGSCDIGHSNHKDILELMAAANFFQLEELLKYCEINCCKFIDNDNIVTMYIHAKIYNADQLLEYCQSFLLQNLVSLLSYNDNVRKLLLGKRRDVLHELLNVLQNRIRDKQK